MSEVKFTIKEIFEIMVGNVCEANLSIEKGDYNKAVSLLKFTNQMIVALLEALNNNDVEEESNGKERA